MKMLGNQNSLNNLEREKRWRMYTCQFQNLIHSYSIKNNTGIRIDVYISEIELRIQEESHILMGN